MFLFDKMCTKPTIYYSLFTLMQGMFFMKNDQISPSILTVCSKITLDILEDLKSEQTKSIATLLEEKDEETEKKDSPAISG